MVNKETITAKLNDFQRGEVTVKSIELSGNAAYVEGIIAALTGVDMYQYMQTPDHRPTDSDRQIIQPFVEGDHVEYIGAPYWNGVLTWGNPHKDIKRGWFVVNEDFNYQWPFMHTGSWQLKNPEKPDNQHDVILAKPTDDPRYNLIYPFFEGDFIRKKDNPRARGILQWGRPGNHSGWFVRYSNNYDYYVFLSADKWEYAE